MVEVSEPRRAFVVFVVVVLLGVAATPRFQDFMAIGSFSIPTAPTKRSCVTNVTTEEGFDVRSCA
jgi:hypothetical protein